MDDVFRECRERVTAIMAAEHFGVKLDRHGKAICPFHAEKTPSFKASDDGWYCFGCQRGGSSIDFVMRWHERNNHTITPLEAVRELDAAFNLHLFTEKPMSQGERERIQAEREHRKEVDAGYHYFESWRQTKIQELVKCIYLGNLVERNLDLERGDEKLSELCHYTLERREWLDYVVEDLLCGPPEKQVEAWAMRKELSKCAKKILSGEN